MWRVPISFSIMISSVFNPFPLSITVGQALLVLINAYQYSDTIKANRYKRLYLLGFEEADYHTLNEEIKSDPHLISYTISTEPDAIFKDPTRRYFETYYARETLDQQLESFPLELLKRHYASIKKCFEPLNLDYGRCYPEEMSLPENLIKGVSLETQQLVDDLFSGRALPTTDENLGHNECVEILNRISADTFNPLQKEKNVLLFKCMALTLVLIQVVKECINNKIGSPFLIPGEYLYSTGMYAAEARGRKTKENQGNDVLVYHLGLMLGTMPLASVDPLFSETQFKCVKPCERSEAIFGTQWVEAVASTLVHTFSTSISGTILLMIRIMMRIDSNKDLVFKTRAEFEKYYLLTICLLLSICGGHSLHEFCAPLLIKDVQDAFALVPGLSDITLESLLLTGNETAFGLALERTIRYNQTLLLRKQLDEEIRYTHLLKIQKIIKNNLLKNFSSLLFLHQAIEHGYAQDAFSALKNNVDCFELSKHLAYRDKAGNTPLHLAAQEGLVYLVLDFLDAHANPWMLNNNLRNVIDHALYHEKYDIVMAILFRLDEMSIHKSRAGLIVKKNPIIRKLMAQYNDILLRVKESLNTIPVSISETNQIIESNNRIYIDHRIHDTLKIILTAQRRLISANQSRGFSDPFDPRSPLHAYAERLKILELSFLLQISPEAVALQIPIIREKGYCAFTKDPLNMGVLLYNAFLNRPQVYSRQRALQYIKDVILKRRIALDADMASVNSEFKQIKIEDNQETAQMRQLIFTEKSPDLTTVHPTKVRRHGVYIR